MRMTNLSIQDSTSSGMVLGANDNFSSAYVNSRTTVQTAHAVFLPCPAKFDILYRAFSGPRQASISWAAKYLKIFPVPNANHSKFIS